MSYEYRYEKDGGATHCFPVDTDKVLWIESSGKSLQDLIDSAKEKWPDVEFSKIDIQAIKHHQYSIYYDLYDDSDYVDYVVLSLD